MKFQHILVNDIQPAVNKLSTFLEIQEAERAVHYPAVMVVTGLNPESGPDWKQVNKLQSKNNPLDDKPF